MSQSPPQINTAELEQDNKVIRWIAQHIGGTLERCERQSRWRGGWWADVHRDGKLLKLYVREERKEDFPPWPLEHEAGVLQVLERHGVPVPHVYGICDDPHAIVMEALPGKLDFTGASDEERLAVLNHYAEVLARMHAIDPRELVAQGIAMPETPEQNSLGCFGLCEDMYLKGKRRPDPRIEFLRRWVHRNVPKHRNKVSIVAVDSAQFLFDHGRVTGLFDMEYACLGDPMIDIVSVPGRMAMANAGDLKPFFRRYAELSGDTFDLSVLAFHRVWWGLCTPLIVTPNLHSPPADGTYVEYIGWYIGPLMGVLLMLGELKGLTLDTAYKVPEAEPSRWGRLFEVMAARLPEAAPNEPYAALEQRKFAELARRLDAHRDVEAEYLRDVERLLGRPVRNWRQADEALEQFVQSAGPEHDDELIALFFRWARAQAATLLDGVNYMHYLHHPFPRFSELIA